MTRIRSQLSGLPSGPTPDDAIRQMAGTCWRQRGILVIWTEEITDPWLRQAAVNYGNAKYGKSNVAK